MTLRKIISGGQTGSDEAGLFVAKRFRLETGGIMPKGFKTLTGSRPEFAQRYGLTEHASEDYVPRTYENVRESDGTVRLAGNFQSRGEVCTLKAIQTYGKPHFDVDLADPPDVKEFCEWLGAKNISVLNVAGNAEQTYAGSFVKAVSYLTETFFALGLVWTISEEELLRLLGLRNHSLRVCVNGRRVNELDIGRVEVKTE